MAQKITKSAKDRVQAAIAAVPSISAEEAMAFVGSPDHVLSICGMVSNRQKPA
jgi:hypothetical protein